MLNWWISLKRAGTLKFHYKLKEELNIFKKPSPSLEGIKKDISSYVCFEAWWIAYYDFYKKGLLEKSEEFINKSLDENELILTAILLYPEILK